MCEKNTVLSDTSLQLLHIDCIMTEVFVCMFLNHTWYTWSSQYFYFATRNNRDYSLVCIGEWVYFVGICINYSVHFNSTKSVLCYYTIIPLLATFMFIIVSTGEVEGVLNSLQVIQVAHISCLLS